MYDLLAAQCADVVVPEASALAMRYYNSGNILWIVQQAWGLIVPLLFLIGGFTGKLEKLSYQVGKKWFFALVIYLALFLGISQLLNLPLDFYGSYIREHEYGLSTQTLARWFSNYGKGTFVSLIGAVSFTWIFYLLVKKSPKRWWLYSSIVSSALLFFVFCIQPIWIDPLFNNFTSMRNKELEEQILHLSSRAGIDKGRVFEVDKSQDTKGLNAYVVGFGATNRIVLWDTTIAQMQPKEILFVMGHEMGHYILHHMWWSLLYFSLLSFALFYFTYKVATFWVKRKASALGFKHLYNFASLPLFLFLINLFMLVTTPVSNAISRCMEHEADRFGLEITQDNKAAGEAFVVLQQSNLANPYPGPVFKFWRSTHPPLGERVAFSNSYCPWTEGKPLKYQRYFQ